MNKKNVILTDSKGVKHESTLWNATDLKKFPVKMETTEKGTLVTMHFKDVTFTKPETKLFELPAEYAKYDSMQTMMQQVMMKRMQSGQGPPGRKQDQ